MNPATTSATAGTPDRSGRKTVTVRIRRQDAPDAPHRYEEFAVPHRPNMNVISCLQWIAAHPTTTSGVATTPPVWDSGCLEEVCGACTMLVNGKVRQSCSALVDKVGDGEGVGHPRADDEVPPHPRPVGRPQPPVQRPEARQGVGAHRRHVRPRPRPGDEPGAAGGAVPAQSRCISCGSCLEACPQYTPSNHFVGAAVISQVRLFNDHPTGAALKGERLDVMMSEGGVSQCGKSGNCVKVCPKEIPLLESIAAVQRQATVYSIKRFFSR